MQRLGPLTLLLVGCILLPAGVLGWVGLRSTAAIETEAERAAARTHRRVADRAPAVLRQSLAEHQRQLRSALDAAGRTIREQWPVRPPDRVLAEVREAWTRAIGIRLGSATVLTVHGPSGFRLWPRELDLPEPARGRDLRRVADRQLAAQLRAKAPGAVRQLLDRSDAELLAAGPGLIDAVQAHAPERFARLRAHAVLGSVGAPAEVHRRWLRTARAADGSSDWLDAWREAEANPAAFTSWTAPIAHGCTVRAVIATAALRAAWITPVEIEGCTVSASVGVAGSGTVELLGAEYAVVVDDPLSVALQATAKRRRQLTLLGIALSFAPILFGIGLARRTWSRERAARRLRDDFIASLSHELRTPLTGLRLHAEMLAESDLDAGTRRRYGDIVDAEAARLSALVDDLLDFAALSRGARRLELQPIDPITAVHALVEPWRLLADRESIVLSVTTAETCEPVMGDPTAVTRIVLNLLQNAWRHGRPPRSGDVSRIEVVVDSHGGIEVRDNGPGIPATEAHGVFESFHRGSRSTAPGTATPGTGLGLSLARELARSMNGDLELRSDPDRTVFRLSLPPVAPALDPLS